MNPKIIDFKMLSNINVTSWPKIFLYSLFDKTKTNLIKLLNNNFGTFLLFCFVSIFSLYVFKNRINVDNDTPMIKTFIFSFLEYVLFIIPITTTFVLLIKVEDDIATNEFNEKLIKLNLLKENAPILKRRANTFKNESYKTGNYSTLVINRFNYLWFILKLSFLKFIKSPIQYDQYITEFLEKCIFDMIKNLKINNGVIKNMLNVPLFYICDEDNYSVFIYDKNKFDFCEISRCFNSIDIQINPTELRFDEFKRFAKIMNTRDQNKFEKIFISSNEGKYKKYRIIKMKI